MSKKFKFILKLIFTIIFCGIIFSKIDLKLLWEQIPNINMIGTSFAFLLMLSAQIISAYKWKVILSIHDVDFKLSDLHRYYYTAMFFNNFLPTSIGGDGYRIFKTINNSRSKASAILAVMMERFSGIFALLFLGSIGGVIGLIHGAGKIAQLSVVIGVINLFMFCLLIISSTNPSIKKCILKFKIFPDKLKIFYAHFGDYKKYGFRTLIVSLISFFFHFLGISRYFILIVSVGEGCPFWAVAIVASLSTVVSILPLSINGIGLLDGSFIYLISIFGVNPEASLLVMILNRALLIPISTIGGMFYLMEKRSDRKLQNSATSQ